MATDSADSARAMRSSGEPARRAPIRARRDGAAPKDERRPSQTDFAAEMLILHIGALMRWLPTAPIAITGYAVLAFAMGASRDLVFYLVAIIAAYGALALIAFRASNATFDPPTARRWRRLTLAGHGIVALAWTVFALQDCQTCGVPTFKFYQVMLLTGAMAATAVTAFTLRHALPVAFAAPVTGLAASLLFTGGPFAFAIAFLVIAAFLYFCLLAERLHRANLKLLSFQAEKMALVAELEIAHSVSEDARRRAEEANHAKSQFLASMSHELRTPLNAILGFSEVMREEVLGPLANPTYKDYAGDIHRSGEHLLNLINEILDLSRIEAGRYELNETRFELIDIVGECIDMVDLKARGKSLTVVPHFETQLPPVKADARAIRQVVLNLLSNAVKFTPAGGTLDVKVGWTAGGGQYVSIRDDGPGIPEDELAVVVSAFGQGSAATKSAEQGTGLGLPIVKAILARHDGHLILRSKLGKGTETIATLPAFRVEHQETVKRQQSRTNREKSVAVA